MKKLNYFYMPNRAFSFGLSANEISVLAVMYACARNNVVKISQRTIADKLGIKNEKTVSRCIRKLGECGFIFASKRPYTGINRLGVTVYYLLPAKGSGGYFRADRRVVLNHRLKTSHLRVYLFICKAVTNAAKTMWNSYNDIAKALKSTRSAVINIIADLVNLKLIRKLRVKDKNGAFSDNHYTLCSIREREIKKAGKRKDRRPFPITHSPVHIFLANRIAHPIAQDYNTTAGRRCQGNKAGKIRRYCKYFFNSRGSTRKRRSIYNPLSPTEKRIILRL